MLHFISYKVFVNIICLILFNMVIDSVLIHYVKLIGSLFY